jgi:hypothetical protein
VAEFESIINIWQIFGVRVKTLKKTISEMPIIFTLTPIILTPIIEDRDEHGDACFLHKIIIPKEAKESLRSELMVVAGISEETLFPDIEGFARDFVWEFKRKQLRL